MEASTNQTQPATPSLNPHRPPTQTTNMTILTTPPKNAFVKQILKWHNADKTYCSGRNALHIFIACCINHLESSTLSQQFTEVHCEVQSPWLYHQGPSVRNILQIPSYYHMISQKLYWIGAPAQSPSLQPLQCEDDEGARPELECATHPLLPFITKTFHLLSLS